MSTYVFVPIFDGMKGAIIETILRLPDLTKLASDKKKESQTLHGSFVRNHKIIRRHESLDTFDTLLTHR